MRDKEPLEQFELSSLKFVYVDLDSPCGPVAYVRDQNFYMHQVRVNTYMGKHAARVVKITHNEISLLEWRSDSNGDWKENSVVVPLASSAAAQPRKLLKAGGLGSKVRFP